MLTQLTCPRCHTPYQAEVHQIIDVAQRPDLKAQLLNGQLNMAICTNCGAGGQVTTPLLYHDPAHELFMLIIPPELNMDQMQREQLIGQLTRQVMEATPPEQRRAYMFQPQVILTMQTFMEKVLETEGITKEMIDRQRKQAELLQTLVGADQDVVAHLIKERGNEIDETFFAMLQSYIDTASQMDDNKQLLPLINLRAKLMTDTPVGRQLEQQQIALHAFNQEAKKQNGLTPALLLKHVLKNQEDEQIVYALVSAAQNALTYEFFQLLTAEIEKQEKAGNKAATSRLSALRTQLLEWQEAVQKQSQRLIAEANQTLQEILAAEDTEAAIQQHIQQIDDVFMYVLSNRIAQADQQGQRSEAQALNHIYSLLVRQVERQAPPEVQFLNQLVNAETAQEQQQILDENQHLLSPNLLKMIDLIRERATTEGQNDLDTQLQQLKALIEARI